MRWLVFLATAVLGCSSEHASTEDVAVGASEVIQDREYEVLLCGFADEVTPKLVIRYANGKPLSVKAKERVFTVAADGSFAGSVAHQGRERPVTGTVTQTGTTIAVTFDAGGDEGKARGKFDTASGFDAHCPTWSSWIVFKGTTHYRRRLHPELPLELWDAREKQNSWLQIRGDYARLQFKTHEIPPAFPVGESVTFQPVEFAHSTSRFTVEVGGYRVRVEKEGVRTDFIPNFPQQETRYLTRLWADLRNL